MNNLKLAAWLVFVMLVLEVGARAVSTLTDQIAAIPRDEWFVLSPTLGWTRRPGFSGVHSCAARADFDENGFFGNDSSQMRDRTQPRVVFIGDSNTFGYCLDPADTFVEVVDELLPEASTINAGVTGYSSFQGYKTLLEQGEILRPDVLVVSFNFNDRRYALDGSDSDELFQQEFAAYSRHRMLELLRASYFVRALNTLLVRFGFAPYSTVPESMTLEGLDSRVPPDAYRKNLQSIVDWAQDRGVDVVLLLLGDNPTMTATLDEGMELLQAGQIDAAIDMLRAASLEPTFGPLAKKYLSEAYRAKGDVKKAREALRVKPFISEHGGQPIYTDADYHEIMREVAEKNGVALVDADALLALTPGDYIDNCHFDRQAQRKVAELLLPPIEQLLQRRADELRTKP